MWIYLLVSFIAAFVAARCLIDYAKTGTFFPKKIRCVYTKQWVYQSKCSQRGKYIDRDLCVSCDHFFEEFEEEEYKDIE